MSTPDGSALVRVARTVPDREARQLNGQRAGGHQLAEGGTNRPPPDEPYPQPLSHAIRVYRA